jgi:hypothetical protein
MGTRASWSDGGASDGAREGAAPGWGDILTPLAGIGRML